MVPEISIIVPVYNTGEYLKKCVLSIQQQELSNIEIILVDDGSQLKTAKICDELAQGDTRIKVIHKKNEGVSIARNTGVKLAKGNYIGFVDSDDWIAPQMYATMLQGLTRHNADMVLCDATTICPEKKEIIDTFTCFPTSILKEKGDINPHELLEIAGSACRCLYKHELIEKNNITFPIGLKLSEDRIFNIKAIGNCRCLYYIKKSFYFRLIRRGSAVNSFHPDLIDTIVHARHETMFQLQHLWPQSYQAIYERQTVWAFYGALTNYFNLKAPLSIPQRINYIRTICDNEILQKALNSIHATDLRARLIKGKHVHILSIIALAQTLKNILIHK